jgi:magnesium transporter
MLRRRKRKKRESKVGQRPGELIYTGQHKDEPVKVKWYSYSAENINLKNIQRVDEFPKLTDLNNKRHWINITGLNQSKWLQGLESTYNIHKLSLEDALNVNHPPKVDVFDHYVFTTLKMILPFPEEGWSEEHISFILQDNLVISLQEKEDDVFKFLRTRLEEPSSKLRQRNSDYLLYALLDVVVDNYFTVIHKLTDNLYEVQENLLIQKKSVDQEIITQYHNEWIRLRQIILPFKTAFNHLTISEETTISSDTLPFLKDLSDHLQQLTNELRMQQDLLQSIVNQNMANLSYTTNEVMRKLTIIATIFIPLTFIAGVYGMNFDHMPELDWEYGYLYVWVFMLLTAAGMVWYLKKMD